jgi:5-methylcytosine-specific restriction protein A
MVNAYERSRTARSECINHYGSSCQVYGFDFGRVYGEIGADFIHASCFVNVLRRVGSHTNNSTLRNTKS